MAHSFVGLKKNDEEAEEKTGRFIDSALLRQMVIERREVRIENTG